MVRVSEEVWRTKYRLQEDSRIFEQTIDESWRRVAYSVPAVEFRD